MIFCKHGYELSDPLDYRLAGSQGGIFCSNKHYRLSVNQ